MLDLAHLGKRRFIYQIAAGVTYAIAAGNSNGDACLGSPARVAAALTVGATTTTDARASFSNFGACLDVFAPGSGIGSAWYTSNTATASLSGTSMATPHVAGAAAHYLQTHTTATPAQVAQALLAQTTAGRVGNHVLGAVGQRLLLERRQRPQRDGLQRARALRQRERDRVPDDRDPVDRHGQPDFLAERDLERSTTTAIRDRLFVEVRSTSGVLLGTLATFSNLHKATGAVYTQRSLNVASYRGQTVRVQFRATTDGSLPTAFRVDDVSLR